MNGEREFIDGYRVARYKVYCANRQVVLGDKKIDLPWRCFEAFLVLIEANGEIVDREVFYHRLWPDVVVEESNLNQAIARLRKQLGDSGAESIIETVPRRGYRLLVRPERPARARWCRRTWRARVGSADGGSRWSSLSFF